MIARVVNIVSGANGSLQIFPETPGLDGFPGGLGIGSGVHDLACCGEELNLQKAHPVLRAGQLHFQNQILEIFQ